MNRPVRRCALGLAVIALAATSCASPPPAAPSASKQPVRSRGPVSTAPPSPTVHSEEAQRYLTNVFQFACAREYIPYPAGEEPPVPVRTEAGRAKRADELTACKRAVAKKYTAMGTVRVITWNGTSHSMSPVAMKWVVQHGARFLDDYVEDLIAGEILRERDSVQRAAAIAQTE